MIALYLVLALFLLFLLTSYICMLFAMRRGKAFDPRDPKAIAKSAWARHQEPVLAGIAWLALQETEQISLESFDGLRLSARLFPAEENRGTILLFHGYRSMVCIDFSCAAQYYHELGFNLLLIDQRSHGHSEGRYLTYGVLERRDCQSWADYCYRRFGSSQSLFLGGLSMGASTVLMASDLPMPPTVRGIIADCGFTSPWEIIAHVMKSRYHLPPFPLLYGIDLFSRLFARCGLRDCSTVQAVARTVLPVLLIHGTGDRFVPCSMSRRAYDACAGERHLVLVEGAGHGASFLVDRRACTRALEQFLFSHLPEAEAAPER